MEIKNYLNVPGAYQKAAAVDLDKHRAARPTGAASGAKNTDVVEFTLPASADEAAPALSEGLLRDASPERIRALKEQIGQGRYTVAADTVAASIVNVFQAEG